MASKIKPDLHNTFSHLENNTILIFLSICIYQNLKLLTIPALASFKDAFDKSSDKIVNDCKS